MDCGCGGGNNSGGPLLSGVLTAQYAEDAGGLALSNPPSGTVDASVANSPGAVFTSGGFWIVVLFIGIAALVVDGARRKNE
jgi:hypothetical protein